LVDQKIIFPDKVLSFMKIKRDCVLSYLQEKEERSGGYTGTDLVELAEVLGVTYMAIWKRVSKWVKEDQAFTNLTYLGRYRPTITLNEFFEIEKRINFNPLEVKSHILSDLQDTREARGEKAISASTFYRQTKQTVLNEYFSGYDWFKVKNIRIPPQYSVRQARDSLSTIFSFSGLKTFGGADLSAIYERLAKAKKWFSIYGIDPISYYPRILTRRKHLRSQLSTIPTGQQEEIQKRLIFEIQDAFIVECTDLLIAELIHRKGRIQQSMNASRQKIENGLRRTVLESIRCSLKEMVLRSSQDMAEIHSLSDPKVGEETMARIELIRRHAKSYDLILQLLEKLSSGMNGCIDFHCDEGKLLFRLATGKSDWRLWGEKEKKVLFRSSDLIRAIDNGNEDVARLIAIDRVINHIRYGKITFHSSYYYQDLGAKINRVRIGRDEGFLNSDVLEQLISGTFPINIWPLYDAIAYSEGDEAVDAIATSWVDFSEVLQEVSRYVRKNTPNWFLQHNHLFRKQTDGVFYMEYGEEEFAERLYEAIGFLGRNLRFRDSEQPRVCWNGIPKSWYSGCGED